MSQYTLWDACGFWWDRTGGKLMVVYAILLAILLALKASLANKCQHKFQPGNSNRISTF